MLRDLLSRLAGRKGRPPNVVWICADDFAAYVSGTYGNPQARTPGLDRLARAGLRFDRAYCSCPLSTPSRMAFLTGRYPRSVGVTLSPVPLPEGEVTIAGLLRAAGYETIGVGKTNFYEPLGSEFDRLFDPPALEFGRGARREPRADGVRVLGPYAPFVHPATVWLNAEGLPFADDAEMSGTVLAGEAVDFLRSGPSRPFFLWVGFYEVHSPFRFPVGFAGRLDPSEFRVPEVTPEDHARSPTVFRGLTPEQKRGIIAAYYTSVRYMDRNVGRIVDALDRSGLGRDTLVVFNSDHGYLLGQHGHFEKHCCYEEAVRIPLLMRMPGVIGPGTATEALVELIDVVPTILELCGVAPPANLQGRSLDRVIRGRSTTHRDSVVAEYADNSEGMVRTPRWKLIHSAGNRARRDRYAFGEGPPGPSTRLYDLDADPAELADVADRPENRAIVEDLLGQLGRHMIATARRPVPIAEGEEIRAILARTLPPDAR